MEATKAGIVNNYEVLHFLFELGRARDAYLRGSGGKRGWVDPLEGILSQFEARCATLDAGDA